MDHLWRHGKAVMSANHQYASIDGQVAQFIDYDKVRYLSHI
jgi:hypothetical protein